MTHARFGATLLILGSGTGIMAAQTPTAGSVERRLISNEFLEVNVVRGTIRVEGVSSDRVEWTARVGGSGMVGAAGRADRYELSLPGPTGNGNSGRPSDLVLRVPRDLKLLHVNLHGAGTVAIDNFDGELTVISDSGDITARNLGGPAELEARNGSVELDASQPPFSQGPVNLLSHKGDITMILATAPSVTLDLSTTCGELHGNATFTGRFHLILSPEQSLIRKSETECSLRQSSGSLSTGAWQPRRYWNFRVGSGALNIHALALQGDINLRNQSASVISPFEPAMVQALGLPVSPIRTVPAARADEAGRAAVPSDSVPRSIPEAERQGAAHRVAKPNNVYQNTSPIDGGSKERRCVEVDNLTMAQSGDFVAGPFKEYYNKIWWTGYGKLAWHPSEVSYLSAPTLTVRAARLDGSGETRVFDKMELSGKFYPTGIHLPTSGRWMMVATAGANWGCFVLTVQ